MKPLSVVLFERQEREYLAAKYCTRPKTQLERPTAENPAESRLAGPSHAEGQPDEAAGHTCMESARSTLEVPLARRRHRGPRLPDRSSARTASGRLAVSTPPRCFRPCRFANFLLVLVSPAAGAKVQGDTWVTSSARAAPPSAKQPEPSISTSPHLQIAACWSLL